MRSRDGARAGSPPGRDPVARVSRVLFLGGQGRSGSTLLDRTLGQIPGFCSAGEVRFLWDRGVAGNQLCGCGAAFRDCPFWTAVGQAAFGGWDSLEVGDVLATQRAVDRYQFLPMLLAPNLYPGFESKIKRFTRFLAPLYRAIRDVSGESVVIDSSMSPSYAAVLRRMDSIDLRVVHLVRDSRGVAASWAKRVRRPEIVDDVAYMPTYRPVTSALRWTASNAMFELFAKLDVPEIRVSYEAFVSLPRDQILRIVHHAKEEVSDADLAFLGRDHVMLSTNHTVAGNPSRFRQGSTPLHLDENWRNSMKPAERKLVTAMTLPLLRRYGYARPNGSSSPGASAT